jgi:hypothetical protein
MNKHAWGAAALLVLAGCGGGSDDSSSTASTPATAAAQLRTAMSVQQARPAAAASAADAAEQLLDFAEASFPAYFPAHQSTSTLDPFRFRHYPQTGVYVGVVVKPGMGYTMDGVYVMGGPFGEEPVYVGQVSAFITPVDPNPGTGGSTGTNNGCFDLGLFETAGTRTTVAHRFTGLYTGYVTSDMTVIGPKTFEGQTAIETIFNTTGSAVSATGVSIARDGEIAKTYSKRTGDAEVTEFGIETTFALGLGGASSTTTAKMVYQPAFANRWSGMAVGQSITETHTGTATTTITYSFPGLPPQVMSEPFTTTNTVKFVGRESVTVPAGTYTACKFESIAGTSTTTTWVLDGKGIPIKAFLSFGDETWLQEATSVKLNGQAL